MYSSPPARSLCPISLLALFPDVMYCPILRIWSERSRSDVHSTGAAGRPEGASRRPTIRFLSRSGLYLSLSLSLDGVLGVSDLLSVGDHNTQQRHRGYGLDRAADAERDGESVL